MKPQWILLWVLLLSIGIGIRAADVDLDNIFEDDAAKTDDAAEAVADEAEAEEEDAVAEDAEAEEAEAEAEAEAEEEDVIAEEEDEAEAEVEAEEEEAVAEEEDEDEAEEIAAPQPAAVPEPTVATPEAAAAPAASEPPSIGHRLAMWLPNRLVDIDDIISGGVGAGAKGGIETRVTRFFQFGGSYGDQYFVCKGYNRQLGGGFESGWGMENLCWSREKRYVEDTFGRVHPYLHYQEKCSIPGYDMDVYKDDKRDLWEIGVDVGWLLSINLFVHPVEIADFVTSIFLYDLREDDF